ncbi:MAG: hypothetical protein H8E55_59060 [Pelagibacterales bacterium]|nr:hypothetical protein [Pelagibacterales bacterium]
MNFTEYRFPAEEVINRLHSKFVDEVQTLFATPMNAEKGLIVGYSEPDFTVIFIRENDGTVGFDSFIRKWKDNLENTSVSIPKEKLQVLFLLAGNQEELKKLKNK